MKKLYKFSVWVVILLISVHSSVAQTVLTTVEAENSTLTGVTVQKSLSGYSGTGYVSMPQTGSISFTVNASSKGTYNFTIRVNTSSGAKTQTLSLNGSKVTDLTFPANNAFFDFDAGNLSLKAGQNTITIDANWGWMNFDKFTLTSVPAPAPHNYTTTVSSLINPNANQKVKDLYAYLRSNYGTNIISGHTDGYYDTVKALTKESPMIRTYDFQHYSQGYSYKWNNTCQCQGFGFDDDGTTQKAINWYNSTNGKGIVGFHWHWHSPSGGTAGKNTFYTDQTTFDASKAVTSGTTENIAIIRDIDSIASQLKKLEKAGVPIMFRPLHEAGGAWFWWGAKGAAVTKQLWDIVYNRINNYHKINNLIWVWSTPEADWYPGNSKVDIIGYDSYPGAYSYISQKSVFDQMYNIVQGQKMVAMTENGPIPDIQSLYDEDAKWAFFMTWVELVKAQNTDQHIKDVFAHPNVITLESPVTAIENEVVSGEFKIYPNPVANGQETSILAPSEVLEVIVCDVLGKTEQHSSSKFTTKLKGLLVVKIITNEGEKVVKLIAE